MGVVCNDARVVNLPDYMKIITMTDITAEKLR